MARTRFVTAVVGATALLVGFTGAAVGALGPRVPDPIPELIAPGDLTIGLETVGSGFVSPVTGTYSNGDAKTLYVAEQTGQVWAVDVSRNGKPPKPKRLVADVSSRLVPLGCFGINYDERGLFGMAFHPEFKHNGYFYLFTSEKGTGLGTCAGQDSPGVPPGVHNHDNVVTEWRMNNFKNESALMVDPTSAREVLRWKQPQFNHNGGELRFGPDGYLYVSTGDGGAADDQGPGHVDGGNAQSLSNLLGKILRIDPNTGRSAPGYTVPADNPYVGTAGALGEIWAHGFRNPYKMSFGPDGTLWVGDVGQNDIEEVNKVTKGGNYGWPVKEGSFAFDAQSPTVNGYVTADVVTGPYSDPVAQYDHCVGPAVLPTPTAACPNREGLSVIGGFVYPQNGRVKVLRGKYVFGEYARGFFESTGRLFYLDGSTVKELKLNTGKPLGMAVLGIGQDERGELYVLAKSGAAPGNTGIVDPSNTSGVVMRIINAG